MVIDAFFPSSAHHSRSLPLAVAENSPSSTASGFPAAVEEAETVKFPSTFVRALSPEAAGFYVVEMEDYTHVKEGAEHILCITPEQPWELLNNADYQWNEGPDILKKDGTVEEAETVKFPSTFVRALSPEGAGCMVVVGPFI